MDTGVRAGRIRNRLDIIGTVFYIIVNSMPETYNTENIMNVNSHRFLNFTLPRSVDDAVRPVNDVNSANNHRTLWRLMV
jgi:hypothetical protein